jgi:hypothetical protein
MVYTIVLNGTVSISYRWPKTEGYIVFRMPIIAVIGLMTVTVAGANQLFQIGGASGLTSAYVDSCTVEVGKCSGGNGQTNGFVLRNYDSRLFNNASNGTERPTPFTSYSRIAGTAPGNVMQDSVHGIAFSMIADGKVSGVGTSSNFWDSLTASTMTVPIGVFGVQNVWTMLNNLAGPKGGTDTVVTFNFGDSSKATSGLTQVAVTLVNSNNTIAGSGQIRAGVGCTAAAGGGASGFSACSTNTANGTLAASSTAATTVNGVTAPGGTTVLTSNLFSFSYTGGMNAGIYQNTVGNVFLDDQGFQFGNTYLDKYLVSMTFQELNGAFGVSQTALSAITVDSVDSAVPEPSTTLLLLSGLCGIGFSRIRRR